MCGLVAPGRGLLTATGNDWCARALGVTARDRLAVAMPGVTARGHTGPATGDSGLIVAPAPAVAGGATALSRTSSGWCSACLGPWNSRVRFWGPFCRLLLSPVSVPAALVPAAAAVACSSSVPAPGMLTPAGAASATASPGRCERAQESSRPERRRRRSSGQERSRSGGKHGRGQSPFPARSAHSASASASSSSESSDSEGRVSALPPPPTSHLGAGGGRSGSDCSASGRTRSPLPSPSGLGSGVWAAPRADRSRLGLHGLSSPTPSGVAEEDRDSISGSIDLDRYDSFRSVLHLIWEFHGMEEPASVAPNQCKTSLALIYGLLSRVFPGSSLAFFPLAWFSP